MTDPDGGWSDFPTNRSGESTSWITAYVLWEVGDSLPNTAINTGLKALLSQRQKNGAWGFSQFTPPDCDSTLHALNAVFRHGDKNIDILKSIKFILSHQSKEGGFRTYKDNLALLNYRSKSDDLNYNGWIQPHICVTTITFETLLHFRQFFPVHIINNISNFLIDTQSFEGYWE